MTKFNRGLANLMANKKIMATRYEAEGISVDYGIIELIGKFYYLIELHMTYHEKLAKTKEESIEILHKRGYDVFLFNNQVEYAEWIVEECHS